MLKKMMLAMLLAAGCSVLLPLRPALGLEIVYPSDKTYVVRSNFLVIKGGAQPPLEGMTVEINGAKSDLIDVAGADYRAAFKDMLILQPQFDPGKNVVTVEGYAGGAVVASAKAEIYYLNGDPSAIPPAGFAPFVMHLPQKEALCAPCHNMRPDKAEMLLESAAANPCASCHRRMLDHKYVHGPAGVYRCGYCHDAGSQPRYKPRVEGAKLCMECHEDKMRGYNANKYVHGPVGAGLCLVCHDAHASEYPGQLLATTNQICVGCHDTVKRGEHVGRGVGGAGHPLDGVPDPTRPQRMLSCASCHDPHGGEVSALFRRGIKGRFSLCQMCHKK